MNSIKKVVKSVKKMDSYLQERPVENLIEGYKKAKIDAEGNNEARVAMLVIQKELERRGVNVKELGGENVE
jgi:5-enolpyruvylshikimate-3-phosphate synthase